VVVVAECFRKGSCYDECRDEQLSSPLVLQLGDMTMTDVFISYAREDRERARSVASALQQVIMRVFVDEATIDYMIRLEGAVDFSPAATPPK
jgi:hypothetical protein